MDDGEDKIGYLRDNKKAVICLRQSNWLASTFEHSSVCQWAGSIGCTRVTQKQRSQLFNVALLFASIAVVLIIVGILGAVHRYECVYRRRQS
jgi:hypothetical protein